MAVLEAKDLKDEVDRARANMLSAKATLAKQEAGYRPQEIKEAEAQVGKTRADLTNKKIDLSAMKTSPPQGGAGPDPG